MASQANNNIPPYQGGNTGGNLGNFGGWTDNQAREYNDLIQQQLGGAGGNGQSFNPSGLGMNVQSSGDQEPFERPTSAPPPPGFMDSQERTRRAEEAIFGGNSSAMNGSTGSGDVLNLSHHSAPNALGGSAVEDDVFSRVTGDSDSTGRGFNMNNLVEALGSDLMDDSKINNTGGGNADRLLHQKFADNPNYTRQTKHTSLRMIGGAAAAPSGHGVSPFGSAAFGGEQSRLFAAAPGPSAAGGFPSSLSSPQRREGQYSNERSTTPVQMHPSQPRGSFPLSSGDVGLSVSEPNDGDSQYSGKDFPSGVVSKRIGGDAPAANYGGDFYNALASSTLSSQSKEFRPAATGGFNDGSSDAASNDGMSMDPNECEADLDPFMWEVGEKPLSSRCIAILHASCFKPPEVRQECEQFGALDSFRSEFAPKGIFFVTFYDIRSAEHAASELKARLQRAAMMNGSNEEVMVRFCMALNSSSQHDESQIVISGLPGDFGDSALTSMLRSYGSIRSCIFRGNGSFMVEFHNIQDAKQAMLELENTQPWGPDVSIDPGSRTSSDRRKGRELLSIISRWRQSMNRRQTAQPVRPGQGVDTQRFPGAPQPYGGTQGMPPRGQQMGGNMGQQDYSGYGGGGGQPETVTQLIMGPDGRYTPVVVRNPMAGMGGQGGQFAVDARGGGQQQIIHGPNGQIFISAPHMQGGGGYPPQVVSGQAYGGNVRRPGAPSTPYYDHSVVSDNISVHSGRSHHSHGTHGTGHSHYSHGDDKDNRHLLLDLDAVENGRDSRTSLMVRNIPNKYTQQMLLSEFTENGHGPGIIDFFYLPIDFKNRCNRGYAFINFVNCKDILAFHRRYYGKQWRTFNSDKICDITYARIQGKAAMLKRFENSALMDKDDEYKPLVFVSDGPEKGKRLPFAEHPAN